MGFLVYKLPCTIALFLLLFILYKITKKSSFSSLLRKYAFWGTFVTMITEGNIEVWAFYLTGELFSMFHFNFQQKIINALTTYFLFFVVLGSISSFVVFNFYYKRRIKYFLENNKVDINGVFSSTIDRGVIGLFTGIIHRVLLLHPRIQLMSLALIEILWIISRISFLRKNTFESKVLAVLWTIQSIGRLCLQVSFFLFDSQTSWR